MRHVLLFAACLGLLAPGRAENLPPSIITCKRGDAAIVVENMGTSAEGHHPVESCVIYAVDYTQKKTTLLDVSFPRYTRALWNGRGDKVVVWNAPDNANTSLWLITRNPAWQVRWLDFSSELENHYVPNDQLFRGGIESADWLNDDQIKLTGNADKLTYTAILTVRSDGFEIKWK